MYVYPGGFENEGATIQTCMDSFTGSLIAVTLEKLDSTFALWSPICSSLGSLKLKKVLKTPSLLVNVFRWALLEACPKCLLLLSNFLQCVAVTPNSRFYQRKWFHNELSTDIIVCKWSYIATSSQYCPHSQAGQVKVVILHSIKPRDLSVCLSLDRFVIVPFPMLEQCS